MCVCVRSVKTEMRETEARAYDVCTLSHLDLVPSWVGRLIFLFLQQVPFVWWDWVRDSYTPLLSMGTKHKLMYHFTGVSQHGNVPTESLKISQSKKITTRVVGVVSQCQWGACMCRCAITCEP